MRKSLSVKPFRKKLTKRRFFIHCGYSIVRDAPHARDGGWRKTTHGPTRRLRETPRTTDPQPLEMGRKYRRQYDRYGQSACPRAGTLIHPWVMPDPLFSPPGAETPDDPVGVRTFFYVINLFKIFFRGSMRDRPPLTPPSGRKGKLFLPTIFSEGKNRGL